MSTAPTPRPFLERDSERMLEATLALPRHIEDALGAPRRFDPSPTTQAIVVAGMGGSGVAGSVLQALAASRCPVPVVLVDSYDPPAFVGPSTTVFSVSFSGETEETVAASQVCVDRGARVIAITTGGRLGELVEASGGDVVTLPGGIPEPRAGIGAMTARLLVATEELGLLDGARSDLVSAVAQLDRRFAEIGEGGGIAEAVAARIERTIPLVHGASGLGAVAARRWKTQVNENAKAPAFFASEPEACHNEICGFGQSGDVTRQVLTLVSLRLASDHPRVGRRLSLFEEIVEEAVAGVVDVEGEGASELAGFFDLVAIGDFVSLHLAGREDVDPGPVPVLTEVKSRMRSESA